MAYGKNTPMSYKRVLAFKIKTKDGEEKVDPYFEVREKDTEGKWQISEDRPTFIKGNITKFTIEQRTYKDQPYNEYKLVMVDNEASELYFLSLRFNMLSQSIFNSLLSAKSLNDISIEVYSSKSGYPSSAVKQGDKKLSWAYTKDNGLPEVQIVTTKSKKVVDTTDLENFFIEKLTELFASSNRNKNDSKDSEEPPYDNPVETSTDAPAGEQDVPF